MSEIENFKFKDKIIEVSILKIPIIRMLTDYDLQIYFAKYQERGNIKIYALFYGIKVEIIVCSPYFYITYFGNIRRYWGKDPRVFIFIKDKPLFDQLYIDPILKSLDDYGHRKINHNTYKIVSNKGNEIYFMLLMCKGILVENILFWGDYNSYFAGNVINLSDDLKIMDEKMVNKKYSNEYIIRQLGEENLVECFSSRSLHIHVMYVAKEYEILFEMTDTLIIYEQLFCRGLLVYADQLEGDIDSLIEKAKFTMF